MSDALRVLKRADRAMHDTAQKRFGHEARTPNTHRKSPEPPDEPGCSACPEGINDHGDLTTRNEDPEPRWKCARCGNRWNQ